MGCGEWDEMQKLWRFIVEDSGNREQRGYGAQAHAAQEKQDRKQQDNSIQRHRQGSNGCQESNRQTSLSKNTDRNNRFYQDTYTVHTSETVLGPGTSQTPHQHIGLHKPAIQGTTNSLVGGAINLSRCPSSERAQQPHVAPSKAPSQNSPEHWDQRGADINSRGTKETQESTSQAITRSS